MTALQDIEDEQLHALALERIKKRQDPHAHALVFTPFNALVWAIRALTVGPPGRPS